MGEMMLMYAAADFAFVGGSFVKVGGHNLLEPAVLGKAVISGSFLFNFLTIAKELENHKALFIAHDYNELAVYVEKLFHDLKLREEMGLRGRNVVEKNRGSLDKHLLILQELISHVNHPART